MLELEPVLRSHLEELKSNHPSIGDVRSRGLFGAVEFSLSQNERKPIDETPDGKPFLGTFLNILRDEYGILTFGGGSHFLTAPPLITTKEDLDIIFERLDKACEWADEIVEKLK